MKKMSLKYVLILLLFTVFSVLQSTNRSYGANVPTNIDFGGMINSHDMMMLREKQRWQDENIDVDNLNKKQNDFDEKVINGDSGNSPAQKSETLEKVFDKNSDKRIKKQLEEQENQKKKSRWFKKNQNKP